MCMNKKIKILVYTEDVIANAKTMAKAALENVMVENVQAAYPNGLFEAIAGAFDQRFEVREAGIDNIRETITPQILADTDVLFWWGHMRHQDVPDDIVEMIVKEVQKGMGFVGLHSAHASKPFVRLLGSTGSLSWRHGDRERVWVTAPYHPIAQGLPTYFELEHEEMYGEPFDIPSPEDTVFIGWFAGGEVFRSGLTYRRGYGKIFYFQPGHEEYPIYYNPTIRLILQNAALWAAPDARLSTIKFPHIETPIES